MHGESVMPRALHADFITQATASKSRPAIFYEGVFASSTVRYWSGIGDITFLGNTYTGNGWIQGLSDIQESMELRANGIDIILSGIPSAVLTMLLTDARQGKSGKIYLAFLNSSGSVIGNTEYIVFEGLLDVPEIIEKQNETIATFSYENRLIELERSTELRYTGQCLRSFFSTDEGLDYVPSVQDWNGYWGNTKRAFGRKRKQKRTKE